MSRPLCFVALVALVIAGAACDDDDDPAESADDPVATDTADDAASGEGLVVTVDGESISIEGSVAAGAVAVTADGPVSEIDFSLVEGGTTEDEFLEAIRTVISGGPFADFLLSNTGAPPGESTIVLEEGQYVVWAEIGGAEGDEAAEPTIVLTSLEVGPGDGAVLPDTDGTFTAVDYGFDVEVSAGDTYTLVNDGPNQFHHAVVLDFGDLTADVVRENLPALLTAGEEDPPPEAFAGVDFSTLDAAASPVHGPGSSGTFSGTLQSGHTYAVVCFIQDRVGGPPHAIAHDMYDVFEVG